MKLINYPTHIFKKFLFVLRITKLSVLVITRCIRKFAIKFSGNLKVSTSKPSHTPNRYEQYYR
jgi:hypothetical protein